MLRVKVVQSMTTFVVNQKVRDMAGSECNRRERGPGVLALTPPTLRFWPVGRSILTNRTILQPLILTKIPHRRTFYCTHKLESHNSSANPLIQAVLSSLDHLALVPFQPWARANCDRVPYSQKPSGFQSPCVRP